MHTGQRLLGQWVRTARALAQGRRYRRDHFQLVSLKLTLQNENSSSNLLHNSVNKSGLLSSTCGGTRCTNRFVLRWNNQLDATDHESHDCAAFIEQVEFIWLRRVFRDRFIWLRVLGDDGLEQVLLARHHPARPCGGQSNLCKEFRSVLLYTSKFSVSTCDELGA